MSWGKYYFVSNPLIVTIRPCWTRGRMACKSMSLTECFAISEPQNPEINKFYAVLRRQLGSKIRKRSVGKLRNADATRVYSPLEFYFFYPDAFLIGSPFATDLAKRLLHNCSSPLDWYLAIRVILKIESSSFIFRQQLSRCELRPLRFIAPQIGYDSWDV